MYLILYFKNIYCYLDRIYKTKRGKKMKEKKFDLIMRETEKVVKLNDSRLKDELLDILRYQIDICMLDDYFIKFDVRRNNRKLALYKSINNKALLDLVNQQIKINDSFIEEDNVIETILEYERVYCLGDK